MSELNDEDLVDKILRETKEWQRVDDEVKRLAMLRAEVDNNFNVAVALRNKLVKPSDREVALLKRLASLTTKEGDGRKVVPTFSDKFNFPEQSSVNTPVDVVNNTRHKIVLIDQSKGFRHTNINIDDVWMKELFGQNTRAILSDGIIFFDKDKDHVICKLINFKRGALTIQTHCAGSGVVVYTGNEHRWFASCNTLSALEKVFEEIAKRK